MIGLSAITAPWNTLLLYATSRAISRCRNCGSCRCGPRPPSRVVPEWHRTIVRIRKEVRESAEGTDRQILSRLLSLIVASAPERISAKDAELMSCATDAVVLISKAIELDLEGKPVQFIRTKFLADRVELVMLQN
ncbi:hypothetical protein [Microvirga sp. Mcv34]|uniref:hypothetical protein n=1 Tax=Microvirga sp. Mcv34 TaxID=2926016 RepID=UPI0021C76167|nr:hypothetical protein [Microvirga sp. Mcv34]